MDPPPFCHMMGTETRIARQYPLKLALITVFHVSLSMSATMTDAPAALRVSAQDFPVSVAAPMKHQATFR